ncbi:MAG: hypothetical protein ACK5ML_04855 [Lachnospiraceae bacterium]
MKKDNRILTIVLAAVLVVTIIFSYMFVIENARHDCSGEDCPICTEIESAIQTISSIKMLSVLPLVAAVICVFTQLCTISRFFFGTEDTLISLKVELLN